MFSSRNLELADAENLLEWRNSDSVAPFMFNDRPIQLDEHLSWVRRSLHDEPTSIRRIFVAGDQPSGFF